MYGPFWGKSNKKSKKNNEIESDYQKVIEAFKKAERTIEYFYYGFTEYKKVAENSKSTIKQQENLINQLRIDEKKLKNKIEKLQSEIEKKKKEITNLKKDITDMQQKVDEYDNLQRDYTRLKKDLEEEKEQLKSTKEEYRKLERSFNNLKDLFKNMKHQISEIVGDEGYDKRETSAHHKDSEVLDKVKKDGVKEETDEEQIKKLIKKVKELKCEKDNFEKENKRIKYNLTQLYHRISVSIESFREGLERIGELSYKFGDQEERAYASLLLLFNFELLMVGTLSDDTHIKEKAEKNISLIIERKFRSNAGGETIFRLSEQSKNPEKNIQKSPKKPSLESFMALYEKLIKHAFQTVYNPIELYSTSSPLKGIYKDIFNGDIHKNRKGKNI